MRNGQLVNVAAIDPNGMATLEDADGQATTDEIRKVGSILLQGPVAQQLKQRQGKEAGVQCDGSADEGVKGGRESAASEADTASPSRSRYGAVTGCR